MIPIIVFGFLGKKSSQVDLIKPVLMYCPFIHTSVPDTKSFSDLNEIWFLCRGR